MRNSSVAESAADGTLASPDTKDNLRRYSFSPGVQVFRTSLVLALSSPMAPRKHQQPANVTTPQPLPAESWLKKNQHIVALFGPVVALIAVGVSVVLPLWLRRADTDTRAADDHINVLIDAKLDAKVTPVLNEINRRLEAIGAQISDLNGRVSKIEGVDHISPSSTKLKGQRGSPTSTAQNKVPEPAGRPLAPQVQAHKNALPEVAPTVPAPGTLPTMAQAAHPSLKIEPSRVPVTVQPRHEQATHPGGTLMSNRLGNLFAHTQPMPETSQPTYEYDLNLIRRTVEKARVTRVPLPADDLASLKRLVREVPSTTLTYWQTVADLVNYQSAVLQAEGHAPDPRKVSGPCLEIGAGMSIKDSEFDNCVINIVAGSRLTNVKFVNSVIRYDYGPVVLESVTLLNCTFELGVPTMAPKAAPKLVTALLESPTQATVQVP